MLKYLLLNYRWSSSVECLNSSLVNKQPLRRLAIEEDPSVTAAITKEHSATLLDDVFWDKVEGFHRLLSPIAITIKQVESDSPTLFLTVQHFNNIQTSARRNSVLSPLLKAEEEALIEIVQKRRTFILRTIHLAANLLDPRFRGRDLTADESVSKVCNSSNKLYVIVFIL